MNMGKVVSSKAKLPLAFVAVGCLLLVAAVLIWNWFTWMPVSEPLVETAGIDHHTDEFRIDLETEYLIEIEAARGKPYEEVTCLLGLNGDHGKACGGSVAELTWSLSANGEIVATGDSDEERHGGWGGTISRTVGRFRGDKHAKYQLSYRLKRDAHALHELNPRIVVRVHPFAFKSHGTVSTAVGLIGLVLVISGVLIFLRKIIRRPSGNPL